VSEPIRAIDYTNLGYESLREAMLALARESLPEWTDLSENDLGVLLVELFAYACDITLYYQTRIAGNLFPATADEPAALVQLLRLIGYELRPPAPATADLRLSFDAAQPTPIVIPAGTPFYTSSAAGEQLTFETEREVQIQASQLTPVDVRGLRSFFPLPVVQGQTTTEAPVAIADGSPNQIYQLRRPPVIAGSIHVTVRELPGVETHWREVETLAGSTPADRSFAVQRDPQGAATIVFGDGTNGMVPPAGSEIRATYRVGGGPQGNVLAGSRFRAPTPIREAINPQAAAGGAPGESPDRARSFAPRLYRTQERAVTTRDYEDLALAVPGVGKVKAVAASWNQVVLYVAPMGQVAEPSDLLKRDLLAFLESRRMVTTTVTVVGPQPADIYLRARVHAQPYYLPSAVRAAVERAVAAYLAFEAVEFGQPIYLSKVYDAIQSLPEVVSLNVTEFSRIPGGGVHGAGIIELGPFELPRPGYRDNPVPPDTTYRPPIITDMQGGVVQ
jgi:uncharacterized phage protein gp47/JayE